ncbi:hypothetical protein [Acidovorax kalamii]|nr:hypothetical protein [Acidovorax kalamii]MCO5357497.1 hypothetical protein [Acidovorax kalamii]
MLDAVDDCITRVKKVGWRGLSAQDWMIVVGAMLLFIAAIIVVIGLLLM